MNCKIKFMLKIIALLFFSLTTLIGGNQPAFSQSKRTTGVDIGYAKVRVRRTGILFPRLTSFGDRRVLREVNRQIDELTAQFGCDERGRNSYYKVRSRVEYAEKDIFSIYATAEYYCNTAYPTNDANQSLTFDLRTGKQVAFEELFKNYEADKREILKTIFAAQVSRSERLAASGRPREETCEGDPELFSLDRLEGTTFSFNFSKAGLSVQPDWPHVIEACAERVTVPYAKLARFAAPDGPLARASR
jgi:hypothetical protein